MGGAWLILGVVLNCRSLSLRPFFLGLFWTFVPRSLCSFLMPLFRLTWPSVCFFLLSIPFSNTVRELFPFIFMLQKFPYHLVDQSPWPILASFSLLITTLGAVLYFHFYEIGAYALSFGLISLFTVLFLWFKDVVREATFQGHHTLKVKNGIKLGLILFILSEVLFFAGFFWAFFHSSLVPAISLGSVWPPLGINSLNPSPGTHSLCCK